MVLGDPSDPKGDRKAASEWELVGGMSLSRGGGARVGGHSQQRRARQARRGCLEILGDPGRETVASAGWQGAHPETPEPGGGGYTYRSARGSRGATGSHGALGGERQQCHGGGGDETATPPITCPTRGVLENGDGPHSQ